MSRVRYLAAKPNYRRILRTEDLAALGVNHSETIVFEQANNWTVEMSDEACETLVNKLPQEFVVLEAPVKEHEVPEETGTSEGDDTLDDSGAGLLSESPDDSLIEADPPATDSPKAKRPRA